MPNPLDRFQGCHQAPHQERLDRAQQAVDQANERFVDFTYRMPRREALTTPQWQEFNRRMADVLRTGEERDRAFLAKQLCETVYTIPPRPRLDPPKSQPK